MNNVNTNWNKRFHDRPVVGDMRFKYVPFHALAPAEQVKARAQYPNVACGAKYNFVPEHYFYPVKRDGTLAKATRCLAIPYVLICDEKFMASLGYEIAPGWKKDAG